jgi:hypothetical protein
LPSKNDVVAQPDQQDRLPEVSFDEHISMLASGTDTHRFFHSDETSDVVLMLPCSRFIRAHKVILAAASGHFRKILLAPAYIVSNDALSDYSSVFTDRSWGEKMPAIDIPMEDAKMTTPAIEFIYGHDFPDIPQTLHDVAEIVELAEKYEIADLLAWATETANNLLAECLGDDTMLKDFLAFGRFRWSSTSGLMHDYAVVFIKQNLKKLQGTGVFEDLVEINPELTVMLLHAVVHEIIEME